jgi:hypothetical protein
MCSKMTSDAAEFRWRTRHDEVRGQGGRQRRRGAIAKIGEVYAENLNHEH